MRRIATVALLGALAGSLPATDAAAQTASSDMRATHASKPAVTDASAQSRRPTRRILIYPRDPWEPEVYPRYNPGPNAVRECTATYVQEFRPSGTVITPRMNCYWRRG